MLSRRKKFVAVVLGVCLTGVMALLLWPTGEGNFGIFSDQEQMDGNIFREQWNDTSRRSLETVVQETGEEAELETLFKLRNKHIGDTCSDSDTGDSKEASSRSINSREFLINSEYKLIWCNIFKSASTSWFHNFLALSGYTNTEVKKSKKTPVSFARKTAYPRPSVEQLDDTINSGDYKSFIIVRHPFERLLSSYRDKIATRSEHFYDIIRCEMAGVHVKTKREICSPTFSQFVDFVIRKADAGEHLDEHWQTYDAFCTPCQFNFSYVLHFENLPAEEEYLFSQVPRLSSVLQPQRLHASNSDYQELLPQYYGQLSEGQLNALIRIYYKDFTLFGYSWDNYFNFAS